MSAESKRRWWPWIVSLVLLVLIGAFESTKVAPPPAADVAPQRAPIFPQLAVGPSAARQPTPETVKVRRYPNIEAPDRITPGQTISIQVSLTMDSLSTGVQIQPGPESQVDAEGRLVTTLPKRKDGKPWLIDVVLNAPDFDIREGRNYATITLPVEGDSTPALFQLTAKAGGVAPKLTKLSATFWNEGAYLARAIRAITVGSGAPAETGKAAPPARGPPAATPATISSATLPPPDLTVYVQESSIYGGTDCQLTIESPFLGTASAPCIPAAQLQAWLADQYAEILRASQSFRGMKAPNSNPQPNQQQTLAMLRGIGKELYRRAAGKLFDTAFWRLVDREKAGELQFRSIQIYTNNPSLPWELMVPVHDDRARDGFLGTEFELARWHIPEDVSAHDKPPPRLALHQVSAIVPRYSGGQALPHQADESAVLQQLAGFQPIKADFSSVQQLLMNPPDGIIHFAGHGVAEPTGSGTMSYAIQLDGNATLDLTSWRGLMHDGTPHHPLYFLNACDVGQVNRVMNFVDGWAPTVLDAGGSGFIGGLWPLSDKGAAAFAESFYQNLKNEITQGRSPEVAQLLKGARQQYFQSGDPTFLGYVFYGDVKLSLSPP